VSPGSCLFNHNDVDLYCNNDVNLLNKIILTTIIVMMHLFMVTHDILIVF